MSYSFNQEDKDFIKEQEEQNKSSFLDLTSDIIYCPKCGAQNIPPRNSSYTINYFCSRCSIKLNILWEKLSQGMIRLVSCEQCKLPTFAEYKFCINCGGKQKTVAKKQSEAISKEMPISSMIINEEYVRSFSQGFGQISKLGIIISITVLFILGAVFSHLLALNLSYLWLVAATILDILSLTGIIASVIVYKSVKSKNKKNN